MKKLFVCSLILLLCATSGLQAQKYFTRDGKIEFTSDAVLEKIEARNSNATCVLDTETGKFQFSALIKAFHFEKALMQEHFNENYMESSKFPKSTFKGQIDNFKDVHFDNAGTYNVDVSGNLTIHGVTKAVKTKGTLVVGEGNLKGKTKFVVAVADYGIKIPAVVKDNIAKEVEIVVDVNLKPFNK